MRCEWRREVSRRLALRARGNLERPHRGLAEKTRAGVAIKRPGGIEVGLLPGKR